MAKHCNAASVLVDFMGMNPGTSDLWSHHPTLEVGTEPAAPTSCHLCRACWAAPPLMQQGLKKSQKRREFVMKDPTPLS